MSYYHFLYFISYDLILIETINNPTGHGQLFDNKYKHLVYSLKYCFFFFKFIYN